MSRVMSVVRDYIDAQRRHAAARTSEVRDKWHARMQEILAIMTPAAQRELAQAQEEVTVALVTPCCQRRLNPVALYYSATINVQRTCNRCRKRWSVTITPHADNHPQNSQQLHKAEWTPITKE